MNIWLVMLFGGIITFLIRFSFIFLFGKFHIPETVRKALHYVPPAVFSALVFPELFFPNKTWDLSLHNNHLLAGIVAIVVGWYSKNTLLTIAAGLIVFFVLQTLS